MHEVREPLQACMRQHQAKTFCERLKDQRIAQQQLASARQGVCLETARKAVAAAQQAGT